MKNPVYRNSVSADIRFAAIYKALSCLAVMSVFMPAVHAVFFGSLGIHPAFTVLTSALCFLLGYGLTEIYARVTGLKRRENDLSYEGLIRYFNAKAAALPIVVIVILSFPVFAFVSKYVRWRYENGLDMYWDPNSLWPLLGTALFIAVAVAGAVLWFYPYYRICSTKYFVWLLAFLLIDAFICRDQRFVVFCTFCYIALSLTVLNQNNLILSVIAADSATRGQSASDSDVAPDRLLGRVTVGMRMYNFGRVMILMLMLGIVLTACIATVVGIVTLGRMLLLFILAGIFRDPEEYVGEAEEAAEAAHKQIFAPEIYGMKSAAESESFFWLFILIAVLAGAFFIIAARTGLAQKILRFIQAVETVSYGNCGDPHAGYPSGPEEC